jgi:hypothetical protein
VQSYRLVLKHRRIDTSILVTNRLLFHWKTIWGLRFVWTLVRGSETSRKVPRTDAELCANCIHAASAYDTRCAHLSQGGSHSHASTPQLKACRWYLQKTALSFAWLTPHSPFPGLGLFIQELLNPEEKRSPIRLAHPWACWTRRTDTFKCQLINCCHMTCCCHWLGESCQIKSPSLQSKYKAQHKQWTPL